MIALADHKFARGLTPAHLAVLEAVTTRTTHPAGSFLLREGERERRMHLLVHGTVALELHAPGRSAACVETLGAGELVGIAWIFDDTASHLDVRATSDVVAFTVDGAKLRAAMDADPSLGYAITQRVLERAYHRLSRIRLTSLDLYGGR